MLLESWNMKLTFCFESTVLRKGGISMGHKIAEAIIEDGQLKYVDKKLPGGKLKVHLIYDVGEGDYQKAEVIKMVLKTSGIYKDIDVEAESKVLRESWKRNDYN